MSSGTNQQQLPQLTQPPVYAESKQNPQHQQNPHHQQNPQYQQNPQHQQNPPFPQYQQQCMHDFKKTGNWDVFDILACVFCCPFNFCCCPPGNREERCARCGTKQ